MWGVPGPSVVRLTDRECQNIKPKWFGKRGPTLDKPSALPKENPGLIDLCFAFHSATCLAFISASTLAYSRGISFPSYALSTGRTSVGL